MDPTTTCCPPVACPARGQTGQSNLGIHARKDQRFIGTPCGKTCTATHGTVCYRLRPAAALVVLLVTLLAHGGPVPAIVAALGFAERTGAAWGARAGRPGRAGHTPLVQPPRDLGQGQADERRVKRPGGSVWMALAMRVKTRVGRAGEVSTQRDLPLMRRLSARGRPWALHRPVLCCTDGLCSSIRAMRETCRAPGQTGGQGRPRVRPGRPLCRAQVVKRSAPRRVIEVERRIVPGTPVRGETLRRRSHGDGVIHTASSERLNAPFRERLAPLARRGRALARNTLPREQGLSLVGTL